MRYALVLHGLDGWVVYGIFPTYGHASRYACDNFKHIDDSMWHIATYFQV